MSAVSDHYHSSDDLVDAVLDALRANGLDPDHLDAGDLAPLEDFHTGGRRTTERLAQLAGIAPGQRVLDIGCGVGGPARFLARTGAVVSGIDLTPEMIELGRELTRRVGLDDRVDLRVADATDLPFDDGSFDVVWTQHVSMNVADKARFYGEAARVLVPGGTLAFFDIMAGDRLREEPLDLPVPWATEPGHSHLLVPDEHRRVVEGAGFDVSVWEDATQASLEMFRAQAAAMSTAPPTGPAPLSPALYMRDAPSKAKNYLVNMEAGCTRVVFCVAILPCARST